MANLASRHCTALKKGTKPISDSVARSLLSQLNSGWHINKTSIVREFKFRDYHQTISFVNAIAWIANQQDHHPELDVSYKSCKVSYTSHAANGLTVNDFICAARIDAMTMDPTSTGTNTSARAERQKAQSKKTKPADQVAKTPKTEVADEFEFDAKEADALLRPENMPKAPAKAHVQDEEDEFELIDVAGRPLTETNKSAGGGKSQAQTPAAKPATAKTKAKAPPATDKQKEEGDELMSTVILPPGMESGPASATDPDEEATVVLPPDEADVNKESNDTFIKPIERPEEQTFEETQVLENPQPNDPDEVRTVILATEENIPDIASKLATATDQSTSNKEQDIEKTQAQEPEITQTIKPVAADSRPIPEEESAIEKTQMQEPEITQTIKPEAANSRPQAKAAEEKIEETQIQPETKPAAAKEQTTEKTQNITSAPPATSNPTTQKAANKPKKTDPGIEEDETLVMHVNTFKSVHKRDK